VRAYRSEQFIYFETFQKRNGYAGIAVYPFEKDRDCLQYAVLFRLSDYVDLQRPGLPESELLYQSLHRRMQDDSAKIQRNVCRASLTKRIGLRRDRSLLLFTVNISILILIRCQQKSGNTGSDRRNDIEEKSAGEVCSHT